MTLARNFNTCNLVLLAICLFDKTVEVSARFTQEYLLGGTGSQPLAAGDAFVPTDGRVVLFAGDARLNAFVDYRLQIRRKDFIAMLAEHSHALVAHATALAERDGRSCECRQGEPRKQTFIEDIIRRDGVRL